ESVEITRFVGFFLLIISNILWVISGEITRFIIIDSHFKKPFFLFCFKTSFLSIYFIKYVCKPSTIENMRAREEIDKLSVEGFELMSDTEDEQYQRTKIRFSSIKEIRRLPLREAVEAQFARRSYERPIECCIHRPSPYNLVLIFLLGPMWILCSLTYQSSMMDTNVTSLNIFPATSSLFLLIFSICLPYCHSKVSPLMGAMVLLNLLGVSLIFQSESCPTPSSLLSTASALSYAVYLISLSKFTSIYGNVDLNFLLGSVGLTVGLISLFLLPLLDWIDIEPLLPLPTLNMSMQIVGSAFFGSLLADRLFMEGTRLTSSLSSSLSLSISIPFSFLADFLIRNQHPSFIQMMGVIPIIISFIGVSFVEGKREKSRDDVESLSLIENEDL
ncbi:hypothetical protein PFISCL1PPCAC_19885, partial [Pristionchus fissidentatus]